MWGPAWIEIHWNSICLRTRSHMTAHYTWGPWQEHMILKVYWDGQCHGHDSWLVCKVNLSASKFSSWGWAPLNTSPPSLVHHIGNNENHRILFFWNLTVLRARRKRHFIGNRTTLPYLTKGHFTHEPRAMTMKLWEPKRKSPKAVPRHLQNHGVWSRILKCIVKSYTQPNAMSMNFYSCRSSHMIK